MKAINLFTLLFTFLIFACTDDEKGEGNGPNPPSYSSSSQLYLKVDTLRMEQLGQSYNTMKIGLLTWFAQNLNEKPSSGKSWCYGDIDAHCNTFGKLYDWEAANHVCPNGWHLPSKNEWEDFSDFLLNYPNNILTEAWWNATYGGYRHENENDLTKWYYLREQAYWWTSTGAGSNRAYCYNTIIGQTRIYRYDEEKAKGLSVRCVKNN
jgi:uncharacterized protein (TIGR02145 family)